MKNNQSKGTVVLNKTNPDGFLDFDSDFDQTIKALNKIKDYKDHD